MKTLLAALSAFVLAFGGALATAADDANLTAEQREEVERIVRETIRENPEIILEAIQILQQRQRDVEAERTQQVIDARRDELFHDPGSPVGGNPEGDVTIVEFFDYACPHCRRMSPRVKRLLEDDGKVRFVYKEFPILGEASVFAARAALAAREQGDSEYPRFHEALMAIPDELTKEMVLSTAGDVGLDVERLQRDMEDPKIEAALHRNHQLASALNLTGTPGFVIGGRLVPGAVNYETLKVLIAEARRGG